MFEEQPHNSMKPSAAIHRLLSCVTEHLLPKGLVAHATRSCIALAIVYNAPSKLALVDSRLAEDYDHWKNEILLLALQPGR